MSTNESFKPNPHRRDFLKLSSAFALQCAAIPAHALELPEGKSLDDVVAQMFNDCNTEEKESRAYVLFNVQSAPHGHNIDIRDVIIRKDAQGIELDSGKTANLIFNALTRLNALESTTIIDAHNHTAPSIRLECPPEVCDTIERESGAYPALPSVLDMHGYRKEVLITLLENEAQKQDVSMAVHSLHVRNCVFTNAGVFIVETLKETDPRFQFFLKNEHIEAVEDE